MRIIKSENDFFIEPETDKEQEALENFAKTSCSVEVGKSNLGQATDPLPMDHSQREPASGCGFSLS